MAILNTSRRCPITLVNTPSVPIVRLFFGSGSGHQNAGSQHSYVRFQFSRAQTTSSLSALTRLLDFNPTEVAGFQVACDTLVPS